MRSLESSERAVRPGAGGSGIIDGGSIDPDGGSERGGSIEGGSLEEHGGREAPVERPLGEAGVGADGEVAPGLVGGCLPSELRFIHTRAGGFSFVSLPPVGAGGLTVSSVGAVAGCGGGGTFLESASAFLEKKLRDIMSDIFRSCAFAAGAGGRLAGFGVFTHSTFAVEGSLVPCSKTGDIHCIVPGIVAVGGVGLGVSDELGRASPPPSRALGGRVRRATLPMMR